MDQEEAMRSYLVVANQTLTGESLVNEVLACSRAEPSRFHVVVPASSNGKSTWQTDGAQHAQAQKRLDAALARFRTSGVEVTGEIGDEKPLLAVGDALRRESYDEIILSTLPPGASKWLKRDLPHKLAKQYHLPVRHVVATRELVS
jgi:GABA permease